MNDEHLNVGTPVHWLWQPRGGGYPIPLPAVVVQLGALVQIRVCHTNASSLLPTECWVLRDELALRAAQAA